MKLSAVLEYVVILEYVLNICMSLARAKSGYAFERDGPMTRVMITRFQRQAQA
jgi:hypothetical protein